MTPSQSNTRQLKPNKHPSTVQVLVANEGNRTVIRNMLVDEFEVDTSHSVEKADLYLIEDRLFPEYRDELRERVKESHPTFCPVVIIQADNAIQPVDWGVTDKNGNDTPLLVDEFVEAPLNQQLLVSRLRSLLVRRQQSLQLQTQVETLERQERKLRRFEHAIEDSGTATVITDTDGIIEYVNPEFEELTEYSESTAVGQRLRRYLSKDSQDIFEESFWRTITDEKEWEGELLVERKSDQQRITDTTITAIQDDAGESEGFVVVMPDITQRIAREQLLQDREQELELLRQILSRYLRHNLRNDLNVIQGYAELLEAKLPEQDAKDATEILNTTKRLIKSSEEARKYSTLIEQESELAPQDLSAIVEEIVSDTGERYPDVSFEVDIPDGCYILARDGISEAIHALIDNAAQHNTADAPWARVTVTESDGVHVVIEDNGPGLPELELETLDRGSESPLKHSQGIGLWLSKWVIEGVGGQLSFDTIDDGGTRVTVDFPPAEQAGTQDVAVSDLKAREQRLKTITQRMTDAVLEVDAAWDITFVDEQAENILGVDADAIQGQQFWDVFSDARDTRFETVHRDVMQSRSAETIEEYYDGIDGWLEIYVYPDFDGGLSFYFRDITQWKAREQELELKSQAMDEAPTGITITDPAQDDNPMIYANDEFKRLTGYAESEIRDRNCRFLQGENTAADRVAKMREAIDAGEPVTVELRNYRKDGTEFWNRVSIAPVQSNDDTVTNYVGFQQDITEQREQKQQLEAERRRFQSLVDVLPHGVYRAGPETLETTYANEAFEQIHGYTAGEWRDTPSLWEYDLHPDDAERVTETFQAHRESRDSGQLEYRIQTADGDTRWVEDTFEWEYDDAGDVTALVGVYTDITERKEREHDLEERIKELGAIQRTVYTFLQSDAPLEELFESFIEELPQSFQYPEITAGKITYKDSEASTADFEPREHCLTAQFEPGTDGTVRIDVVYLSERPPEDDGPFLAEEQELLNTLAALIGGYVERLEYIQQLERKNEQLEAFTSIVSHDLRNPLSVAQGRLELVKDECQSEEIEHITDAHDRIETLIENMLTLARRGDQVGETTPTVLSEIVESCWQAVETNDATFDVETEQIIVADENGLRQLLENLMRNSVEHGGDDVTVTVGALDDGFYIEDDGLGIPKNDHGEVFDAGYSTSVEGTGFGLAIVKQIADAHGWTIRVTESAEGGARFEITGVEFAI